MFATEPLAPQLADRIRDVLGADADPIGAVEQRARGLLGELRPIVWEGDPQTFQFEFVGGAAEEVLGYPATQWTTQRTFWADTVVHPEDRNDAIAFCAVATGKGQDHEFQYRARCADGRVIRLRDIVKVIKGPKGIAVRLRGIMFELPAPLE